MWVFTVHLNEIYFFPVWDEIKIQLKVIYKEHTRNKATPHYMLSLLEALNSLLHRSYHLILKMTLWIEHSYWARLYYEQL